MRCKTSSLKLTGQVEAGWYRTKKYYQPKDIVAVAGGCANNALALKDAGVVLSVGIQGTDVPKLGGKRYHPHGQQVHAVPADGQHDGADSVDRVRLRKRHAEPAHQLLWVNLIKTESHHAGPFQKDPHLVTRVRLQFQFAVSI